MLAAPQGIPKKSILQFLRPIYVVKLTILLFLIKNGAIL
jgi:hypothetical protein